MANGGVEQLGHRRLEDVAALTAHAVWRTPQEEGKNLGDVLGLETALIGTWAAEKPETMTRAEAERLVDDPKAFDRLVERQLLKVEDDAVTVMRPKLIGVPITSTGGRYRSVVIANGSSLPLTRMSIERICAVGMLVAADNPDASSPAGFQDPTAF